MIRTYRPQMLKERHRPQEKCFVFPPQVLKASTCAQTTLHLTSKENLFKGR